MKKSKLSLLLLFVFLIVSSCNKDKFELSGKNFDKEVPLIGNLEFTFNKEVVPDSLCNSWDTTEYIKFKPSIPGKYRWENPSTLIFSPASALPEATEFEAEFTKELNRHSKLKFSGETAFRFHTPYMQLEAVNAFWILPNANSSSPEARIDISFNYPIDPRQAAALCSIQVDKKKTDFSLVAGDNQHILSILLPALKAEDREYKAEIEIKEGLKSLISGKESKDAFNKKFVIPSPFRLDIQNVETGGDGIDAWIKIYTSQKPKADRIEQFISIDPSVSFKTQIEEDGILLRSEQFNKFEKYSLLIKKGLLGIAGGKLKEDYEIDIAFGEPEPQIQILDQNASVLSMKGSKNIAVSVVGVQKLKVRLYKIYENNILSARYNGFYSYDDYYGEEDYEYYDYTNYATDYDAADIVWEKEFVTKDLPKKGQARLLKLNFSDKLAEFKGAYYLKISSEEDYWVNDVRWLTISDLGLIAKIGKDFAYVFVNELESAKSASGVELKLIGKNNQLIASGKTDGDGYAALPLKKNMPAGFKPALLTARNGNDFNMLSFSETEVSFNEAETGGLRENPGGYDAMLYPERDLYRPGETVNLAAIVRAKKWSLPGEMMVKLRLSLPNGKEFKTIKKLLDNQGGCEGSFTLPTTTTTGTYSAELFTANDLLLAAYSIQVEEFLPDRIKVSTKLSKEKMNVGESSKLELTAVNYFGPPAADRNYEVEIQTRRGWFQPKAFDEYDFGLTNAETYFSTDLREGITDENGLATEEFAVPKEWEFYGLLNSTLTTTVFDENGRPVSKQNQIDIHTQNVYYGIKYFPYYVQTNQSLRIPIVAVNKDGVALSNIKANVQIIKYEYKNIIETSGGGSYQYRSQKTEKILVNQSITINGTNSSFNFTPTQYGDYTIRIFTPGVSKTYVDRSFYSYGWGWGNGSNSDFEVDKDGDVKIKSDKDSYKPGEKAQLLFSTPFDGRLLVTVERNELIEHYYLSTTNKAATLQLPISDQLVPNVYITASLFKPHKVSDIPLTVAHGILPISVENPSKRIDVKIQAANESRSNSKQTISIQASPNSNVTIAVVDEGILSITGFESPDPFAYFYGKRALEVSSFDLYAKLFAEFASGALSGGDGEGNGKRLNPITNKRAKLISFWSGIRKTDGSGKLKYDIDIPAFSGQLRVMCLTYKNDAFGFSEHKMTVADPVVISAAAPRFLSPGDTLYLPVMLSNTTKSKISASANIHLSGPLKVIGKSSNSLSLNGQSESFTEFKIYANKQLGPASIRVDVKAGNETFSERIELPVRPASPLQKQSGNGVIKAGTTQTVSYSSNFIPSTASHSLVVGKSPLVQFTRSLDYLVKYPYGCMEQTISTAFPQLYYQDLCQSIYGSKNPRYNPASNIQDAIQKIGAQQTYNGGLTLWPNGYTEDWWVSAYGAHFLVEAKKAGYTVDERVLNDLISYLSAKVKIKNTISYYFNGSAKKDIAPKEMAYSLYVLALANKADLSTMNYYKANSHLLALDSRYLLAATYKLGGNDAAFKQIVPSKYEGEVSNTTFGNGYYSALRDQAISLNALIEADPQNPQIAVLSKYITQQLKESRWLNTQESSFCLLALGKIAKKANATKATAEIYSKGSKLASYSGAEALSLSSPTLNGSPLEIKTSGSGELYYFWESEGMSGDGSFKQEDSYLKVRKSYFNRYGQEISSMNFKQNDIVVIRLSLESQNNMNIENVVISDILPAGFEIENPRISDVPGMNWVTDNSYAQHIDIRDDRINLFTNAGTARKNFYYAVRCVSTGVFKVGPVGADAMYNGEYHSYWGAGTVKIVKK